jgi:hypothetical protein
MIMDEDALAEEDLFILDKMKEMVSGSEVIHLGAAKQLLSLIERTVSRIRFPRLRCPLIRSRFQLFPGHRRS